MLEHPRDVVDALSRSIGNARVDLNPHQVDAALFAMRSPYTRGVLLADEVGLGKTIEAALVLAQKWAERRRRILLVVPATLRKQWQIELLEKFYLPSIILEAKTANALIKEGARNPFVQQDRIIICSYQFAYSKRELVKEVSWDLVVIDEAHRLRSIYKGTKTAEGIVDALGAAPRILLTATPLQNTLLELYGLVSILDPDVFGGLEAFQAQFMDADVSPDIRDAVLRERIKHVCKRTLRRQVVEYIPFTNRFTHTADFVPTPAEEELYEEVSAYLQREVLVALPNTRRKLITLIMRKLLASSPAAIGATLTKFAQRLTTLAQPALPIESQVAEDFEAFDALAEEWEEDQDAEEAVRPDAAAVNAELSDLQRFVNLATAVQRDSKAAKLIEVLPIAFEKGAEKGSARKVVIFTESRKTQEYLFKLLNEHGYAGQIVLMNGSNNDETSKLIYKNWRERHASRWQEVTSGSKSADMKAAIVEEFRERATILLATESAAEGVNLQFCSIVVNYDLPWNPQRIEQRIGRCHRYGQKSDVLVVNFLNRKNEADRRVFELLDQKFQLFRGVFGASDDVLGAVESGVDLERRIAAIYQDCRTTEEIKVAFDTLQAELDEKIRGGLASAQREVLENFDAEVHERLRLHRDAAKASLDKQQQMLLDLAKVGLSGVAVFDPAQPRFRLLHPENGEHYFHLEWQQAEALGDVFFRVDHPLAAKVIELAQNIEPPPGELFLVYESHASALEKYRGTSGWLEVTKFSAEALNRREQFLIVTALDQGDTWMPPDVALKLLSLHGSVGQPAHVAPPVPRSTLDAAREAMVAERVAEVESRSATYFDEEAEKLDRRMEDLKVGLEREIKKLEKDISDKGREARRALTLQAKLDAQKEKRDLELKYDEKRRQYFAEQDRIKIDHDALIDRLSQQLQQRTTTVENVFCVRWTLLEGSALDILERTPAGRLFKTSLEVDEFIRKERDSWER